MQETLPNTAETRIRTQVHSFWRSVETGIYISVACIFALTAILALVGCGPLLLQELRDWNSENAVLRMIDRLLLILMVVEILHTVRISIRSHVLVAEPFLIVGLIAAIRRILVIALEAANLSRPEVWHQGGKAIFLASTAELGLLGFLVLIFVGAICLLRRSPSPPEDEV